MSDAPQKASEEAYDLGMKVINWVVIVEKIGPAFDFLPFVMSHKAFLQTDFLSFEFFCFVMVLN